MPSYISHAIMGEELHNEATKERIIFKTDISKSELRGYSLGADLSYLSKQVKSNPHDFYTRDFFISMIRYIKENKLTENSNVMALLYGHIAHYFLDIKTHPLIYYLECGCERVGIISNHDLIEGYISAYLSQTILNRDIMDIPPEYFSKINIANPEISNLLNSVYGKIYGDYHITRSYQRIINLFITLETCIKKYFKSKKMLITISQFENFLKENNLTTKDIINEEHQIYTNPITGEQHSESFIELYNQSIQMTLEAIYEVNRYLYDGNPIGNLDKVFNDLSYDTGVACSLGTKMTYVRKRILRRKNSR